MCQPYVLAGRLQQSLTQMQLDPPQYALRSGDILPRLVALAPDTGWYLAHRAELDVIKGAPQGCCQHVHWIGS